MNYAATLEYLYEQLPMFSRIGDAAIKKDLTNTLLLCEALGNPQHKFKSIHIAGTNGKGSCAHLLASVLKENGYTTGLYTSPHLKDFRERIKINGQVCSEDFVVRFVERIQPEINRIQPSFFEITVAMAFEYFAEQKVDIAVIETGLGGRLDSTNVITPLLSIITNISKDHVSLLGNTLYEIALEKAGIIKTQIPVVVGRKTEDTKVVFETIAKARNSTLYFTEDYFESNGFSVGEEYSDFYYTDKQTQEAFMLSSDLRAVYQQENIITVYHALEILKQNKLLTLDVAKNRKGFQHCIKNSSFFGRWQTLQQHPKVIADVAHNEDGVLKMIQQLRYEQYAQLHIVYGAVKDKDIDAILKHLPRDAQYYFTEPLIPRKLEAEILCEKAKQYGLVGEVYTHPVQALGAAKHVANSGDLILVTGSFLVLSEVLDIG